jgi:hypothetical protein
MTKREKLSKIESAKLQDFVGKCVIENVTFPPVQMGGSNSTIQEIMHGRSVDTLGKYNDFLETQSGKVSRLDRINGSEKAKRIGNSSVTYAEAVENIDLIIKNKLYEEYRAKVEDRVKEINKDLESLETPKERKTKLEKEKRALLA